MSKNAFMKKVGESNDKLNALMSYLDGVEDNNNTSSSSPYPYPSHPSPSLLPSPSPSPSPSRSYTSSATFTLRNQKTNDKLVRDSVTPGKKWVWDDWNGDDKELELEREVEVSQIDASYNDDQSYSQSYSQSQSYYSESVAPSIDQGPPSTLTQNTYSTQHDAIKSKIKVMRGELEEKRQEVTSLKATVARRKTADERIQQQIEDSWIERIKKRRNDHKAAIKRQDEFVEKLAKDCEMIDKRREGLEEVLHYKIKAREGEIEATKREAEKNMKLERENWLSAEKVRLEKLASAKSSELKKDAVKALEPELHRLLSGNKLDLQQRVESYEEQFEAFQCEREKEAGVKLQEEKRRMEKEAEGESEKIRKAQSIQLLEIAETHEHDLKTSREANNREIESERASFEVERRRRVATYNSEIDELRENETRRVEKLVATHDKEMQLINEKREAAVDEKKAEMSRAGENWQRERLEELRGEVLEKEKAAFITLLEQSKAELNMVIARLQSQNVEEVGAASGEVEKAVEAKREIYDVAIEKAKEEESVIMSRYALEKEKDDLEQEECDLLLSRVTSLERRVASTEAHLKKERARVTHMKMECEVKLDKTKKGRERDVELADFEVKNLMKHVDDLNENLSDSRPIFAAEIERLRTKNEREVLSVLDRVDHIKRVKDEAYLRKEIDLKAFKEETKHKMAELDLHRKRDLQDI